ncbi:hypothetical protein FRB96_000157 [Tulasnella sp. 330]|nr:hypothetical protein FRB96_000157 [Tulasnella sp. 330]
MATPDESATYYWFTIDDDLPYLSFFEDWGPLNLGQVYKACILIHELLEDKELKPHRLVLYSSNDPRRKANAALLMALFVQIVQRRQPWEAFHPIAEMEFMPFRDAGRGRSDFNLSIQDCLYGFWKATQYGLCDLNEFSLEDYEYYEKVENGDWNWITPHFIAFASPVDTVWMRNGGPSAAATNGNTGSRAGSTQPQSRGQTPAGSQSNSLSSSTSSLQKKLPTPFLNCLEYFSERGIKSIVRLNNPLYDKNTFIEKGFEHVELYFDDGTNPTDEIVRKFLDLSDKTIESGGVVAVHCKAGLGRTGTLIGAYLIYKYGFTANEAIAFMRIVRPGCVVGPQQQYMYTRQLEWAKWAAVDEYRRTEEADRPVTRLGAITPPDDVDELAIVPAARPTTPSTPKANTRQLKQLPVTPPQQVGNVAGPTAAAVGPLDMAQDGPPPGQPRKTPRAKRVVTEMDMELDPLESQHLNLDLGVAKAAAQAAAAAAATTSASDDDESEEKKLEAEEAKDELSALQNVAPPPASPVKVAPAGARGRVAAPKQIRPVPATERAVRTTRATTRNAAATTAARTAGVPLVTSGAAAALRAKGAASVAKAKAASGSGAGAATTTNPQAGTSYKIPRLATNTPTVTASVSRMRPPSAMGSRRAARPVSPSPSGSPKPIQNSRLPVPSSLIPSKRGYSGASPHLPNGGGPIHAFSETSTTTLQLPPGKKKKGRRGSAGSIGSVVSTATASGITGGDSALLDPDAWMSGEAAGAVVNKQEVEHWPQCDILISFYSTDFPLKKAVSYVKLRQPVCINDLATQELLWDRRAVLAILDHLGVQSPHRVEVSRDGGPKISEELRKLVEDNIGLKMEWSSDPPDYKVREDGDAIIVNGRVIEKPFVEKPVSGEDHNINIYHRGGGGRRLFRKIGNQSSIHDQDLTVPRTDGSYIYEEFIDVENDDEMTWARKICEGFGQRVCGFDVLRPKNSDRSMVIDVNGWSFVKGNEYYYDRVAEILADLCFKVSINPTRRTIAHDALLLQNGPPSIQTSLGSSPSSVNGAGEGTPTQTTREGGADSGSWMLKMNVTVFRHADRTPKQKLKYTFPVEEAWTQPFIELLNGEQEELILRERSQLEQIVTAIEEAKKIIMEQGTVEHATMNGRPPSINAQDDLNKLAQLKSALEKKIDLPGTKAQLKPSFKKIKSSVVQGVKEDGEVDLKEWDGGEGQGVSGGGIVKSSGDVVGASAVCVVSKGSHSPGAFGGKRLEKFQLVFKWGGEFTHAARYQSRDLGENMRKDLSILNKDMLNDVQIFTSSERRVTASAEIFAAALLDTNSPRNTAFSAGNQTVGSPLGIPVPSTPTRSSRSSEAGSLISDRGHPAPTYKLVIRKDLLDDSNAAKDLMDDVKKRLKFLLRNGESERRPELTWPKTMNAEPAVVVQEVIDLLGSFRKIMRHNYETMDVDKIQERWCCNDDPFLFRERWEKIFDDFCETKREKFDPSRVSELYDALKFSALHHRTFLFAIFSENGAEKQEKHDRKLHELYARAKALFDLVAPQEYGIEASEKEEIGVLTSLPLMRKIVEDLEAVRNSGGSGESHIHTLVNLVLQSGLPIANPRIPELDYASHITFELYERSGHHSKTDKEYSIRLSISEGAHSSNVLDSALDARHALSVKPRRRLTQHLDYSLVIEKLSKHFDRVPVVRYYIDPSHPEDVYAADASEPLPDDDVRTTTRSRSRPWMYLLLWVTSAIALEPSGVVKVMIFLTLCMALSVSVDL